MADFSASGTDGSLNYFLGTDEANGRGRCLYASKDIKAGTIVIDEEPYCFIVANTFTSIVCANCGIIPSDSSIYALGPEDPARYCSIPCLQADNAVHLGEIATNLLLQSQIQLEGNADPLRLIIRIASMRSVEAMSAAPETAEPSTVLNGKKNTYRHILFLEAVRRQMSAEDQEDIGKVAEVLSHAIAEGGLEMSCADIEHCVYAMQSNAHRINDDGDRPVSAAQHHPEPHSDDNMPSIRLALGSFPSPA